MIFNFCYGVLYPQFMNRTGVLGQSTLRINLGSKILTWLNSFGLFIIQTGICIFALSLLIVLHVSLIYSTRCCSMFTMWSIFTATRPLKSQKNYVPLPCTTFGRFSVVLFQVKVCNMWLSNQREESFNDY